MAAVRKDGGRGLTIAVCGCTGTGKSQLAVELARFIHDRRVPAEIISADSMQMYRGLDVITNKVTSEEMAGVKHHMLNELDPSKGEECDVVTFVTRGRSVMSGLHQVGGIPIVVGGTNYYIQHLLLPGDLVALDEHGESSRGEGDRKSATLNADLVLDRFGTLLSEGQRTALREFASTAGQGSDACSLEALQMWQLLRALDPDMAARWHVRDHRKVHRSLCVLLESGRRHSELIVEQQECEREAECVDTNEDSPIEKLVIWLHCDSDVLRPRLDARVDRMVQQGLLNEIVELGRIADVLERQSGRAVDHTRGIFQTIGYKEFARYLDHIGDTRSQDLRPSAHDRAGQKLFDQALEEMKAATRHYARRQTSWMRNKLVPAIHNTRSANAKIVTLDASDLGRWNENVANPARQLVQALLDSSPIPPSIDVGRPASAVVEEDKIVAERHRQRLLGFDVCAICSSDEPDSEPYMVMRSQWDVHRRGRVHRSAMHRRGLLSRRGPDLGEAAMAKRAARQARNEVRGPSIEQSGTTKEEGQGGGVEGEKW